jgi:hypothetical protein
MPTVEDFRPVFHVASVDIGRENFAICIAKIDARLLSTFHRDLASGSEDGSVAILSNTNSLPSSVGIAPFHTSGMKGKVESVFSTLSVVSLKVVSLASIAKVLYPVTEESSPRLSKRPSRITKKKTRNSTKKTRPSHFAICRALTWFLDRQEHIEKLSFVAIEQQMSFGKNVNVEALRLAQHCASYFFLRHPRVDVYSFPAYHKTQVFGFDRVVVEKEQGGRNLRSFAGVSFRATTKLERKKWVVVRALQISDADPQKHGRVSLTLRMHKKADDLADTFLQLGAFIVRNLACLATQ